MVIYIYIFQAKSGYVLVYQLTKSKSGGNATITSETFMDNGSYPSNHFSYKSHTMTSTQQNGLSNSDSDENNDMDIN